MKTEGLESLLFGSVTPQQYVRSALEGKLNVRASSRDGQIALGLVQHVPTISDCVPEERQADEWWYGLVEETGAFRPVKIGNEDLWINHSVPLNGYWEGDPEAMSQPLEVLSLEEVPLADGFGSSYRVVHWVYDPVTRERYLVGRYKTANGREYALIGDATRRRDTIAEEKRKFRSMPVANRTVEKELLKLAVYR